MIGRRRRYFAQARAPPPVEVGMISAAASSSSASSTAACMTAADAVSGATSRARPWISGASSAACGDLGHRQHRLDRVGADARLGREHHRGACRR